MLAGWNFAEIANALSAGARAVASGEPTLKPEPLLPATEAPIQEPTLPCRTPAIALKRRALLEPAPPQPSAKEHAVQLLEWIRANIDAADGPITHAAILEYYMEAMIELDWTARPWNPVAHQFRLLTTGNRKTYAWIRTTTGAVHRLRVYPIPARVVDAAPTPETTSTHICSRGAPKLRRAA